MPAPTKKKKQVQLSSRLLQTTASSQHRVDPEEQSRKLHSSQRKRDEKKFIKDVENVAVAHIIKGSSAEGKKEEEQHDEKKKKKDENVEENSKEEEEQGKLIPIPPLPASMKSPSRSVTFQDASSSSSSSSSSSAVEKKKKKQQAEEEKEEEESKNQQQDNNSNSKKKTNQQQQQSPRVATKRKNVPSSPSIPQHQKQPKSVLNVSNVEQQEVAERKQQQNQKTPTKPAKKKNTAKEDGDEEEEEEESTTPRFLNPTGQKRNFKRGGEKLIEDRSDFSHLSPSQRASKDTSYYITAAATSSSGISPFQRGWISKRIRPNSKALNVHAADDFHKEDKLQEQASLFARQMMSGEVPGGAVNNNNNNNNSCSMTSRLARGGACITSTSRRLLVNQELQRQQLENGGEFDDEENSSTSLGAAASTFRGRPLLVVRRFDHLDETPTANLLSINMDGNATQISVRKPAAERQPQQHQDQQSIATSSSSSSSSSSRSGGNDHNNNNNTVATSTQLNFASTVLHNGLSVSESARGSSSLPAFSKRRGFDPTLSPATTAASAIADQDHVGGGGGGGSEETYRDGFEQIRKSSKKKVRYASSSSSLDQPRKKGGGGGGGLAGVLDELDQDAIAQRKEEERDPHQEQLVSQLDSILKAAREKTQVVTTKK